MKIKGAQGPQFSFTETHEDCYIGTYDFHYYEKQAAYSRLCMGVSGKLTSLLFAALKTKILLAECICFIDPYNIVRKYIQLSKFVIG